MGRWSAWAVGIAAVFFVLAPAEEKNRPSGLAALVETLGQIDDPAVQLDALRGMNEALRGRKEVPAPPGWKTAYQKLSASRSREVRDEALRLALVFGDTRVIESLRRAALDASQPPEARRRALVALVESGTPRLSPLLHRLLDDKALRATALASLAAYDDEATPREILRRYSALSEEEKAEAIGTLASRVSFALALLDAVEQKKVPRSDITAHTARQLQAFADKRLNERLSEVWGTVRRTSGEKEALLAKYKALLTPDYLAAANLPAGRKLFEKNCGNCHRLYGEGGQVGPDLTGSNRKNLDYVLENVLDPSAAVSRDYKLTLVLTTDGRLISGILSEQPGGTVTVQTANQRVFLSKDEIERSQASELSMMPEGGFDKLTSEEVRDLVAYLKTEKQVK